MVEEGKFVAIHYTGKLDDGEVFDSCDSNDAPFEFRAGSGMVIKGLDDEVIGMNLNEEKDLIIVPENAYGEYNEALKHSFKIEDVRGQIEPEVGMRIGLQMRDGHHIPAEIVEVTDTEVVVDANHPLAGKTLHFHIKVVDINDAAKYTADNGCDCGCDCDGESSSGCSC